MAEESVPAELVEIKKLANLALSEADGNEEERRTAAVEALRRIREHKFLLVKEEDLRAATQAVNGARAELERHTKEASKKMMLGFVGGLLGAKLLGR